MKAQSKKSKYALRCGDRLRKARNARGWTQSELSRRTRGRLSRSRIANYEQGLNELGIYETEILAAALQVFPAYLMGFTDRGLPLAAGPTVPPAS